MISQICKYISNIILNYRILYKSIEDKLNAQSKELVERDKVIAELKNSISDITDKYNKLKIDYEKQKQYYIQLSLNMRNQKKKITPINSNSSKNITSTNFGNLQISNFSLFYHNNQTKVSTRKKIKLKTENHSNASELKKLKQEFENIKKSMIMNLKIKIKN